MLRTTVRGCDPRLIGAVVVVALFGAAAPRAQTPRPANELEVRAAYLVQFGRYVEWPEQAPGSTFDICVLGEDPFGAALDEMVMGKTIGGASIALKRIVRVAELVSCRILFVSRSEDDRLQSILKVLARRPVLTVGDGLQFTRRGGIVSFTSEDRKVRFVINRAAAETANLKLSSQLLRIAANVEP